MKKNPKPKVPDTHGGIDNALETSPNPQGDSSAYAWKPEPKYNYAPHIPDSKLDGGKA